MVACICELVEWEGIVAGSEVGGVRLRFGRILLCVPLEVLDFSWMQGVLQISEVEPGVGEKFGTGKALDVGYLSEVICCIVEASVAPSMRKTYLSGKRRYYSFCKGVQFSYLPLTEDKACLFVAYFIDSKLKYSTIKCNLSAVRRLHVVACMGDPFAGSWQRLECALKGVKRAVVV